MATGSDRQYVLSERDKATVATTLAVTCGPQAAPTPVPVRTGDQDATSSGIRTSASSVAQK